MNAALGIADAGYEVYLVEKELELGGGLREIQELQSGEKAAGVLAEFVDKVTSNERIKVYTNAREEDIRGRAGSFKARITGEGVDEEVEFGACVIATEARDFVPEGYYGYGKEKNPDVNVFVLYQDIKTYGKWEVLYKEAREKGVIFLRYDKEKPPEYEDGIISIYDVIFNDEIQIKPDLVVLSTPAMPAEENERLSKMFMIPLKNGFFMEAQERPKMVLTPVDTVNEGVFICGSAVYPAMIDESLAMSSAAASRACVLLAKDFLETPAVTSVVDEQTCSGCGVCADMCPVEAIELTEEPVPVITFGVATVVGGVKKVAKVGDGCIGCGCCASYCPSGAMSLRYFKDRQVYALRSVGFCSVRSKAVY